MKYKKMLSHWLQGNGKSYSYITGYIPYAYNPQQSTQVTYRSGKLKIVACTLSQWMVN